MEQREAVKIVEGLVELTEEQRAKLLGSPGTQEKRASVLNDLTTSCDAAAKLFTEKSDIAYEVLKDEDLERDLLLKADYVTELARKYRENQKILAELTKMLKEYDQPRNFSASFFT